MFDFISIGVLELQGTQTKQRLQSEKLVLIARYAPTTLGFGSCRLIGGHGTHVFRRVLHFVNTIHSAILSIGQKAK